MDFTAILDVAIGMSLVYLGVSLYVTIVNEFVAQFLRLRGKQLAKDLVVLVDDPGLQASLKKNPALAPFLDASGKAGSYVDPNMVARLLLGTVRTGQTTVATVEGIVAAIGALPDSNVKAQLSDLALSASQDVDKLVAAVSHWVDQSLTVMGEVYKKRVQLISFGIGLFVALGFNVNTLSIAHHLYSDKAARTAAVALAVEFNKSTDDETFTKCLAMGSAERSKDAACTATAGLADIVSRNNGEFGQLPVLWSEGTLKKLLDGGFLGFLHYLVGGVITALAVSLGAPFWFDLLNTLINVRHGARRPEVKGPAAPV